MSHLHTSLYIWTSLNSADKYFVRTKILCGQIFCILSRKIFCAELEMQGNNVNVQLQNNAQNYKHNFHPPPSLLSYRQRQLKSKRCRRQSAVASYRIVPPPPLFKSSPQCCNLFTLQSLLDCSAGQNSTEPGHSKFVHCAVKYQVEEVSDIRETTFGIVKVWCNMQNTVGGNMQLPFETV